MNEPGTIGFVAFSQKKLLLLLLLLLDIDFLIPRAF